MQIFIFTAYSIWSNNVSAADIFVESNMVKNIESLFKSYGVKYEILIDDVEQAIKEENPPLTPEAEEELEGRKGLSLLLQLYYNCVL